MNLLLYANYLLNAEVLQPEPNNKKCAFNKIYFRYYNGWCNLYLMDDERLGE